MYFYRAKKLQDSRVGYNRFHGIIISNPLIGATFSSLFFPFLSLFHHQQLLLPLQTLNPSPTTATITMNCSSKSLSIFYMSLHIHIYTLLFIIAWCMYDFYSIVHTVSGELPEEPVVSKKSGLLYEKRLIERHISVFFFFSLSISVCSFF